MIRVVIADDHAVVRRGLLQLFAGTEDVEIVAAAADGREAVEAVKEHRPDLVIMDLSMPEMDGVEATRAIRAHHAELPVVILTSFSERERILDAIDAGAVGYLLKDADPEELLRGVRAAATGDSPFSPRAARALLALGDRRRNGEGLTARERQILALVGQGLTNQAMAHRLGISLKTVKAHLSNVFQRIGVTDRTQAALWAQRNMAADRNMAA
ncbi:MAG TPA: response regulator transcription factor [Acidimicrobiales bacterium]|nr:response regulator transcription factor [Acidimicrobiales bacterium]